jgi:hypothetical protein
MDPPTNDICDDFGDSPFAWSHNECDHRPPPNLKPGKAQGSEAPKSSLTFFEERFGRDSLNDEEFLKSMKVFCHSYPTVEYFRTLSFVNEPRKGSFPPVLGAAVKLLEASIIEYLQHHQIPRTCCGELF